MQPVSKEHRNGGLAHSATIDESSPNNQDDSSIKSSEVQSPAKIEIIGGESLQNKEQ
jgi:hypothetical protein